METYETNPGFARVSFLRNTKSAALGVSGFEKRNIRVPRAVSPAILELELELIQTQMTQKPMLRAEVYARALRASQNRKEDSV